MQVEDVTGVGLTAGGAAQQQRHLTVGDGLLRKIVEDDERVHAVVAEVLTDGATRVRGKELQWGSVRCSGSDDRGELHGVRVRKRLHELSDGRALLADGNIDAEKRLLLVAGLVDRLLVNDGIDCDGGLASLAIADDELTLAAADRHKGVDGLETALHGLRHGLACDNTGGLDLNTLALHVADDRALPIDGVTQAIDDAAEHAVADRDVNNGASALDGVALLDDTIVTEDNNTDIVVLQVQSHTAQATIELHHLTGLHLLQPVHTGDAVTNRENFSNLLQLHLATKIHNFFAR
mmetsp:Transcript_12162/g.24716  ORF Transcript_12162/g.24716 Transcript_12162/m.24716 type:complete len:293 (-) Transcript_12162:168-1046(-)